MSEWQPIETAPKDGTPILVKVDGFIPSIVQWDEDISAFRDEDHNAIEEEWYEVFTHWCSLPPSDYSLVPSEYRLWEKE